MDMLALSPGANQRGFFNLPMTFIMLGLDNYVLPRHALAGLMHLIRTIEEYYKAEQLRLEQRNGFGAAEYAAYCIRLGRLYGRLNDLIPYAQLPDVNQPAPLGITFDEQVMDNGWSLNQLTVIDGRRGLSPSDVWTDFRDVLERSAKYFIRLDRCNDFVCQPWQEQVGPILDEYLILPKYIAQDEN